jgi:DNA replication and repair protein RecF
VVLFSPEDLDLVIGSPVERRRYLDITLSQIDHRYLRSLQEYQKVVAQRNSFLHNLRDSSSSYNLKAQSYEREQLALWNTELVKSGAYIIKRRLDCLHALNQKAALLHQNLVGLFTALISDNPTAVDGFELRYTPSFALDNSEDEADISARFYEELSIMRNKELARGVSLVGPHRDDFTFQVEGTDVAVYGSRGQQRTAVLALKLAEVSWMETQTGDRPILLLDDILSELDTQRRQYVLETVQTGAEQILITTTDLHLFNDLEQLSKQAALFRVVAGQVIPL